MEKNLQWWLVKIDRAGAWILMGSVLAFFMSSYGMEKGIFDRQTAKWLHTEILPALGVLGFTMHTSLAVRMSLMRWRWWNKFSKAGLITIYAALVVAFVYYAYLYGNAIQVVPPAAGSAASDVVMPQTAPDDSAAVANDAPVPKDTARDIVFTATQLAQYDGENGNAAYIAVDGIIYDVGSLFVNGSHHGCRAGQDVTAEFYDEHSKSILTGYPIIGNYKAE